MMIGAETAGAVGTRRRTPGSGELRAAYWCLSWLHRFSRFSPVFTAIAGITVVAGIAKMVAGSSGQVPLVVPLGIALFATAAAGAGRIVRVVEQWLEVLGQAFDAAPEAQLVATPEGRAAQANLAFERLFPGAGEAALDLVEQAAAPASLGVLRSLREQAAGGAPAVAAIPLRCTNGGPPQPFEISVEPAAGRTRYCLWTFREGRGAPAAAGDTRRASDGGADFDRAANGFPSGLCSRASRFSGFLRMRLSASPWSIVRAGSSRQTARSANCSTPPRKR